MQRFFFFLKKFTQVEPVAVICEGTKLFKNVPDSCSSGTLEHPNVPWRPPHPFVGNGY